MRDPVRFSPFRAERVPNGSRVYGCMSDEERRGMGDPDARWTTVARALAAGSVATVAVSA